MALRTDDDDIFKEADLRLVDDDDEDGIDDEEEEEEQELNELEKENEDEEMQDDNENDDEEDAGQDQEDDEDDDDNDNNGADAEGDLDLEEDGTQTTGLGDMDHIPKGAPPSDTNATSQPHLFPTDHDVQLQQFYKTLSLKARLADSYDVVPTVAIPFSSQVHSLALSANSRWLFAGGEDGFIRKYDFYGSVDGEVQLTAAQKHNLVDLITNGGALNGYWENEVPQKQSAIKGDSYEPRISAVYSLAVEKQGFWLLSGLANGGINMQSVRHNEGAIIHHFKQHTDTVSVLTLNSDQTKFASGSWDKIVNLWDLNTGAILRSYAEATGQITSLQYRPSGGIDIDTVKQQIPTDDDDLDSLFGSEEANGKDNGGDKETEVSGPATDDNVLMTASIDGCIYVLDTRTDKAALKLRAPKGTPPWCVSACWSESGDSIFVGRRNSTVEEFSLKMPFFSNGESRPSKTLKFPSVSGPVTVVKALPNHNHVVCASHDNIRMYDLRLYTEAQKKTPFLIIPGHHGGCISEVLFDPAYRYMVSASGNRGWQGTSTEVVFIYDIGSE